uniref:Aminopeptidase B n=1 Tax=Esox lucius TaxID=8010 RepID=A0A6Q2YKQ3_ESOLU
MDESLHSDLAEDVSTSSSFRQFKIKHFHLDLSLDFEQRTLRGTETLQLKCIQDSQTELLMDIHPSLSIQDVSFCGTEEDSGSVKVEFLTRNFTSYGTTLVVKCPSPCKIEEDIQVVIQFVASDGPGVCWLKPEQTAGKAKPYVFTQGQAVLNRSFFPCFDTPAVKSTYSASVKVPDGFTAVMSASKGEHRKADNTFLFTMEQPIPSYLVALAVGDLVSAEVGPRYDVLFMPPSFPFGGMENPCLTFVTPCLLAGDRSLADVIVHEICHSWFGNLVTNANWGDFWLNEGFTMYAQRRVCTEIYGEAYASLEAATGRALLRQHMDNTGEDHPLNKLRVKIKPGVDPDDTYNETPYEKGFCFVSYLAHLAGEQSRFDAFLKAYIDKFKFRSIMAEDALEFYLEYFPDLKKKDVHKIEGLEFDTWLNVSGWPPYLPDLSAGQSLMKPAEQLSELWGAEGLDMTSIRKINIQAWKTYQTAYFLEKIIEKSPLPRGNIEKLEGEYPHIVKSNNAELRLRWAQIIAKNQHQPGYQHVRNFLSCQGKQKYTLPVYRALWNGSEETRALATEIFNATSHQLHINVCKNVKKIIT